MAYLVVKNSSNAKESFVLTNTANKPRMAVNNSYIPLTTTPKAGVSLKVKGNNNQTYRPMVTSTAYSTKYRSVPTGGYITASSFTQGSGSAASRTYESARTSYFDVVSYNAPYITANVTYTYIYSANYNGGYMDKDGECSSQVILNENGNWYTGNYGATTTRETRTVVNYANQSYTDGSTISRWE